MEEACERLKQKVAEEEPDNIMIDKDGNRIAKVAVSVDGRWQKWGHSSKIGVVFVMSVLTGEVLDFEVLSHVCHTCRWYKSNLKDSAAFETWYKGHENECEINHVGSSGDMENKGAVKIFEQSLESRGLRCEVCWG